METLYLPPPKLCIYCQVPLYRQKRTVDHLIPVSRGGKSLGHTNKVHSCSRCNGIRSNLVSVQELIQKQAEGLYQRPKFQERRIHILSTVERLIEERGLGQFVK